MPDDRVHQNRRNGSLTFAPLLLPALKGRGRGGAVDARYYDRSTMGESPPRAAEEADEDVALGGPAEDIRGINSGCNTWGTREPVEAVRSLLSAEASKGEGKRPEDEGRSAQESRQPPHPGP